MMHRIAWLSGSARYKKDVFHAIAEGIASTDNGTQNKPIADKPSLRSLESPSQCLLMPITVPKYPKDVSLESLPGHQCLFLSTFRSCQFLFDRHGSLPPGSQPYGTVDYC